MVHLPHRKAPLTPAILLQFYHHLNVRDSAHLAVWCALLVGFFSFFRTANLVPQSFDKFSSHHTLSRGSITFATSGALLTVTRTKTRQAGDAALVVPVPRIPGSHVHFRIYSKLLLEDPVLRSLRTKYLIIGNKRFMKLTRISRIHVFM